MRLHFIVRSTKAIGALGAALALTASGCLGLLPPAYTSNPQAQPGPGEEQQPGGPEQQEGAEPMAGGSPLKPVTEERKSAPVPTTLEIKSECSKTVRVFYGEKPKFG